MARAGKETIMHSLVAVIAPTWEAAEDMLAQYLEANDVAPYVEATRGEWMREERAWRRNYQRRHPDDAANNRELAMSDDQFLAYMLESADANGESYDGDGNRISTFNPDAHWDWYELGGRWSDEVKDRQGMNAADWDGTGVAAVVTDADGWVEPVGPFDAAPDDRVWFVDRHQ